MKPINKRLYELWKALKKIEEVPDELLVELEDISNDITKVSNPYLPDDLVESINKYAIPQKFYGDKISILQSFNIDYVPDELPSLSLKYIIMNNDYKEIED